MVEQTRTSAGGGVTTLSAHETPFADPAAATLQGRPPRRIFWVLIAAALALHLIFLDGLGSSARSDRVVMATAVEVRSVPAPVSTPTPVAAAPKQALPAARLKTESPRTPSQERTPVASARAAAPPPPTSALEAAASSSAAPVALEPASPSTPTEGDVPVYRTQLPPSMRLQYALRRGAVSGVGELHWRLADGGYQLSLDAQLAGAFRFSQSSQGRIDDAGLAPLRFTDQRRRGGLQAANFQRDKNTVTFSGPNTEYPLLPGTQDRLSWMLQLAAITAAEPERLAPGGQVVLYVVGARGGADVWVFRFVDFEVIETPQGPVRTAKFSRDARRLYDTQVDVWLDPARHHLPAKARWGSSPDGDPLELQLQSVQSLQIL